MLNASMFRLKVKTFLVALSFSVFLLGVLAGRSVGRVRAGGAPGCRGGAPTWSPKSRHIEARSHISLSSKLQAVAINDELILVISNKNLIGNDNMLDSWVRVVQAASIKNYMVAALDDETALYSNAHGYNNFRFKAEQLADKTTSNHGASSQKFNIIAHIINLGYSVLLSDIDVVWLRDPFHGYIFRDVDVESMSDGYDFDTALGHITGQDTPSDGWSRFSQSWTIYSLNSGLFYLRASEKTHHLMNIIHTHLASNKDWDQSIFNKFVQQPLSNHVNTKQLAVTLRIMDLYQFSNSKTLFSLTRHNPALLARKPVCVHVNYHSTKRERFKAIYEYYNGLDNKTFLSMPNADL